MFNEIFMEVISKEGIVSITTCADNEAHVVNTWNSYLLVKDNKIFIPVFGMKKTEANVAKNSNVLVTLGSKEVQGKMGPGTGFCIKGTAKFYKSGEEFDKLKEKFTWLNRVLEVSVESVKQTI